MSELTRVANGLLWCTKCRDYTQHYHELGEKPRYCSVCRTEWKRGK